MTLNSDGAIAAAFNADYAGEHTAADEGIGALVWSPGATPTVLRMVATATGFGGRGDGLRACDARRGAAVVSGVGDLLGRLGEQLVIYQDEHGELP